MTMLMILFISISSLIQSYLEELFQILTSIPFPYINYVRQY